MREIQKLQKILPDEKIVAGARFYKQRMRLERCGGGAETGPRMAGVQPRPSTALTDAFALSSNGNRALIQKNPVSSVHPAKGSVWAREFDGGGSIGRGTEARKVLRVTAARLPDAQHARWRGVGAPPTIIGNLMQGTPPPYPTAPHANKLFRPAQGAPDRRLQRELDMDCSVRPTMCRSAHGAVWGRERGREKGRGENLTLIRKKMTVVIT